MRDNSPSKFPVMSFDRTIHDFGVIQNGTPALKTIIRSNPGALEIKSGTIVNKWHYNDFNKIKFD